MDEREDHFWQKFAEWMLASLTVFFVGTAYWGTWAAHIDFAAAMLDNSKLTLGALLGLLTKQAFTTRASDLTNGGTDVTTTKTTVHGSGTVNVTDKPITP